MKTPANDSPRRDSHQRVVITGMGAVTPVGHTAPETWEALKAGRSGVVRYTMLDPDPWPCKIGGELRGFDPGQFIPRKKIRHMAFASQLAVVAAGEAVRDAGLDLEREDRDRVGVVVGTAGGSMVEETERATMQMMEHESQRLSPFQIVRMWPNMASYFVAEAYRLRGYSSTVCTACASATQAIGEAAEVIRRGGAEVMVTGGTESMVSATVLAGFVAMRALATSFNDAPEQAMRPFDADREGFVWAQGSAMLVLESLMHARDRGAHIYAEVLGHGVSNDIHHMIAPDPEGKGAALAVRQALASARVSSKEVDYINAHGTSTPLGDAAETRAIKAVFGKRAYEIPISSTKSMIGHMMGATGAVEAIACVMSIQEGIIHPTINYETPDPECDLDYVPNKARKAKVKVAVSNSFGLGGQNAVLVLGAV
ncbi:MAG: beta-ketoacyl-ACP synthase II [Hyphomicrobiaceae bacterium]|nr:beta-ketoacyl-ACP synthase II [Hyphomicrobiaceae bacterium]